MGRFSPTVLPNSGEVLSRALGQGVDSFLRARRQRDEDQRQAKADERQSVLDAEGTRHNQAMEGMTAFQHGFVKDDMKGIDRRTALTGGQVNDAMSVATGGVTGPALATALGRPAVQTNRYGPSVGGYSYDEESDVAQNARVARALSVSQTNRNNRPPEQRPTAQGHVVDPVTGEVKFFDPTHPPSGLRVNPAPRPASYTPVTMGGDDGTPAVVRPFNNRTGEVGAQVGNAKPSSQFIRPTDSQRQVVALLPEIQASHALLNNMGTQEALNAMASHAGTFSNYLKTEQGQLYQQAADQFITNLIYAKSGKAVTDAERAALWRTYIGEPGNAPSALKAKQRARELALQGLDAMSGVGAPGGGQAASPAPASHASPPAAGAPGSDPEAEWAKKNPPRQGESYEQYHARYLNGGH